MYMIICLHAYEPFEVWVGGFDAAFRSIFIDASIFKCRLKVRGDGFKRAINCLVVCLVRIFILSWLLLLS